MNRRVWTLVAVLGVAAVVGIGRAFSQGQKPSNRRVFNRPGVSSAPVSDAVLAGDTLYISGRGGLDPKTGKTPDNLDEELENLFNGHRAPLASAGLTMRDLVSVDVFCSDLALYDNFSAVYRAQFSREFPARG